jgi:hypothetical protein
VKSTGRHPGAPDLHLIEAPVAKSEFAGEFALSPDGQWLAFGERFHAYVTPLPQAGKPVTIGKKWMRCRSNSWM